MIYELLGKVMDFATSPEYEEEVKQAKEEFFGRTGQVYEDDEAFETRMTLFLEWYLFDRKINGSDQTPFDLLMSQGDL